ncbi:hypothetical protein NA57DRAFT_71932 [Rhizodiscina lignyota]|uniref:Sister chromatid cohesion protein Dcc1 n=1 Tax=Rhizodiscina lignyota TaxID=1504668 RepID=A0A9P4IN21_9PEZI|nr:hypothetical protein NA57DRAFT_71932 [Rhizodiscina lignyota]
MATQDQPGIPFSIAHEQQNFRLLELPDELVELLSASDAPFLQLKSSPPSDPSTSTPSKPANAVLCTANKTYQIRQVQTSNSVFFIQPSSTSNEDAIPTPGVTAIATIQSTLELLPSNHPSPSRLLDDLLLKWNATTSLPDFLSRSKGKAHRSKQHLFSDVPLSGAECGSAWYALCAFQHEVFCVRPTVVALHKLWRQMVIACLVSDIDIAGTGRIYANEIWEALKDEDEGWPLALVDAVVGHLGSAPVEGGVLVEKEKLLAFIGGLVLETETVVSKNMDEKTLVEKWKENVPDKWRGDVSLELIKDNCKISGSIVTALSYRDELDSAGTAPARKDTAGRKWHEKFKAGRR